MLNVVFSTASSTHKFGGSPAKQTVSLFANEEEALSAQILDGHVFAYFATQDGRYVYSKRWGWEFHAAAA